MRVLKKGARMTKAAPTWPIIKWEEIKTLLLKRLNHHLLGPAKILKQNLILTWLEIFTPSTVHSYVINGRNREVGRYCRLGQDPLPGSLLTSGHHSPVSGQLNQTKPAVNTFNWTTEVLLKTRLVNLYFDLFSLTTPWFNIIIWVLLICGFRNLQCPHK